jgi:uncharacterized repeat protein (TIGR03803 family)
MLSRHLCQPLRNATFVLTIMISLTLAASAADYKILYTFGAGGSQDAESPAGGLVRDAQGNLYGTTVNGGAYEWGTVFELSPNSDGMWIETILYSFSDESDRAQPAASLALDGAGNLYSTASLGGSRIRRVRPVAELCSSCRPRQADGLTKFCTALPEAPTAQIRIPLQYSMRKEMFTVRPTTAATIPHARADAAWSSN